MAYRQRGEGSFTHLVPQDCRTCKKSKNCKLKNQAGSHCSMRDRMERWVYQYYVRDIANKPVRKSVSAKTRKLLLDKVDKLREKPQETVGTLGAWMDVWLDKVIKGSVKTSTYAYYKYMLKYVPEDVRQKPLKSLTLELFADLFQKLYATGSLKDGSALSTTTVRGVRNTLKSCLEVAVKQNLIPFNPVRETRPLRSITKDIVVLSKEEAKRLQSVADNVLYRTSSRRKDKGEAYLVRQWAVLIRLLLATGVRRSEAFGLQWENVDFQNRNIRICKSLYKGTLPNVRNDDSLAEKNLNDFRGDDLVDYCALNPPYGGVALSKDLDCFPADMRSSETADLFVALAVKRLKHGGRGVIVLPDGFLFGNDNAKVAIKKYLLSECNLHTIIRLPQLII